MLSTDDYIQRAKERLGNSAMSDRELGDILGGFGFSSVSKARYGNMSDPLALRIAEVLGVDAGEVLMVARAEREKDPAVKAALNVYLVKILAGTSKKKAHPSDLAMSGVVARSRIVRGSAGSRAAKNTI